MKRKWLTHERKWLALSVPNIRRPKKQSSAIRRLSPTFLCLIGLSHFGFCCLTCKMWPSYILDSSRSLCCLDPDNNDSAIKTSQTFNEYTSEVLDPPLRGFYHSQETLYTQVSLAVQAVQYHMCSKISFLLVPKEGCL